jgi:hypothetical protein
MSYTRSRFFRWLMAHPVATTVLVAAMLLAVGVIALAGLGHLPAQKRAAVVGVFLVTAAGFGGIVTLSILFRLRWLRGGAQRGRRVIDLALCVLIIVPVFVAFGLNHSPAGHAYQAGIAFGLFVPVIVQRIRQHLGVGAVLFGTRPADREGAGLPRRRRS